jgi:hypothetical protein
VIFFLAQSVGIDTNAHQSTIKLKNASAAGQEHARLRCLIYLRAEVWSHAQPSLRENLKSAAAAKPKHSRETIPVSGEGDSSPYDLWMCTRSVIDC